jgi:hypothetical protein
VHEQQAQQHSQQQQHRFHSQQEQVQLDEHKENPSNNEEAAARAGGEQLEDRPAVPQEGQHGQQGQMLGSGLIPPPLAVSVGDLVSSSQARGSSLYRSPLVHTTLSLKVGPGTVATCRLLVVEGCAGHVFCCCCNSWWWWWWWW